MLSVQVENMCSPKGNLVPNQFKIFTDQGVYFQSYNTVIAVKEYETGKVFLDPKWNYSRTTAKYLTVFLRENTNTIRQKIKSGEYTVKYLNQEG